MARIFKKENSTQFKFAGAYVPANTAQVLVLYCIIKRTSKSKIIIDLLTKWAAEHVIDFEQEITSIIIDDYMSMKNKPTNKAYAFKIRRELAAKGVGIDLINKVVANFLRHKQNEKKTA